LGDSIDDMFTMRFDPQDKQLAIGTQFGEIKVFNISTGLIYKEWDTNPVEKTPITAVRWRP